MNELNVISGPSGTIQLPKSLMKSGNFKENEKVKVNLHKDIVEVKKVMDKKKFEKFLAEGYKNTAKQALETTKDFEVTEKEANRYLDDY